MMLAQSSNIIPQIPLDEWSTSFVDFVTNRFSGFFDLLQLVIGFFVDMFQTVLTYPPPLLMVAILALIAWFLSGWRVALFTLIGFLLLISMRLWDQSMLTLALVLSATVVSLVIGIPLGILAVQYRVLETVIKPILDFMQTMPAFVYLIPGVVLLGLGNVPALLVTVIFSMPPAIRLTMLGIQQVSRETVEASQAFGATSWQTLIKVELPQAMPTIMAGVNQVIMLALSMVVIAALIGAGGLGAEVQRGLAQLDVGTGFEGGLGIVIIAIVLDRITRNVGTRRRSQVKNA